MRHIKKFNESWLSKLISPLKPEKKGTDENKGIEILKSLENISQEDIQVFIKYQISFQNG
jgi:hypothetical protein